MKKLIFLLLLIPSIALAETVQVFQISNDTIIVLGNKNCPTKGKTAVVQKLNGKHIKGCWYEDPTNKENVRIDWSNPDYPGDFAVIQKRYFGDEVL